MTGGDSFEPYALAWARQGFVPLPLRPTEKVPHPLLGSGWTFDTIGAASEAWVWNCWNPRGTVQSHDGDGCVQVARGDPLANVGVVTGSRSRCLLLDLDVGHGARGPEALWEWEATYGRLPEAPWMSTPSGGFRVFYALPEGVRLRKVVRWLPGVDALADGAQSAVWPSVVAVTVPAIGKDSLIDKNREAVIGVEYAWLDGAGLDTLRRDMPPAPTHLVEDVRTRPPSRPRQLDRDGRTGVTDPDRLPPTAELLRTGFEAGACDDQAWALACRLAYTHRRDPAGAEAVLREVWELTVVNVPGDPSRFTWEHMLRKLERARGRVEPLPTDWRAE